MAQSNQHDFHEGKFGAAITVRVIPRSSRNEIAEILPDGTIKIRLTSIPEEKELNRALLNYLAKIFNVSINQLEVVAGFNRSDKLITILGIDTDTVQKRVIGNLS
ncbi:MAG: DUF167 domain-containing protein [Anaerolineaceae bacterium]|jgi:uncharacterized protein YggU (UPF0235/DUF167 family)